LLPLLTCLDRQVTFLVPLGGFVPVLQLVSGELLPCIPEGRASEPNINQNRVEL